MTLIRWQPFSEIETLRRQMDRLFDGMTNWEDPRVAIAAPAIEIADEGDHLVLKAEIPGIDAQDLDISVMRQAVILKGERRFEEKKEEKGFFRSEFRYGSFARTIPLPTDVQNEKVTAEYKDGVLTLTLPKAEDARDRAVKISVGTGTEQLPTAEQ
jgi:HSP20 family protein